MPIIVGTPLSGEKIDGDTFDGKTEMGIFPGDLPSDPGKLLKNLDEMPLDLNFVRFRPFTSANAVENPKAASGQELSVTLPHIRLDRAIEFLIGDKLL